MVECFLAKEDVAGSNPVSRSKKAFTFPNTSVGFLSLPFSPNVRVARYPSGKGEVCKTFMRRFDPDPRLHSLNNPRVPSTRIDSIDVAVAVESLPANRLKHCTHPFRRIPYVNNHLFTDESFKVLHSAIAFTSLKQASWGPISHGNRYAVAPWSRHNNTFSPL